MPRRSFTAGVGIPRQRSSASERIMEPTAKRGVVFKRRPVPEVVEAKLVKFVPPVRLRYLVLLAAAAMSVYSVVPRVVAYWQLHSAATDFANYALCMVGPTGPQLLKDEPDQFWQLVRRRLVSARAESRPFAKCEPEIDASPQAAERLAAHGARANEFEEFASFAASTKPTFAIEDLLVTTAKLELLARHSRPFSHGYEKLVQPTRNARTVPHPVPLPRPMVGSGLPVQPIGFGAITKSGKGHLLVVGRDANRQAYRSSDEGNSWTAVDPSSVEAVRAQGKCGQGSGKVEFRLSVAEGQLRIESWAGNSLETSFPLAPVEHRLREFSCDLDSALVVTSDVEQQQLSMKLCPHLKPCRNIRPPQPLLNWRARDVDFSLTRTGNTIVAALARRGIVRVVSSRDDGVTWTPPTVAYDQAEHVNADFGQAIPNKLLTVGKQVLLYAGSTRSRAQYPVLMSRDSGASWTSQPLTMR